MHGYVLLSLAIRSLLPIFIETTLSRLGISFMPFTDLIPGLSSSPVPHALLDATHHLRWTNSAWNHLCAREARSGDSWFDQVDDAALRDELPHIASMQAGIINTYTCASRLRAAVGMTIPVTLKVVQIEPELILVTALHNGSASDPVLCPLSTPPPAASANSEDKALVATLSHDFRQHLRMVTSYLSLAQRQGSATLDEKIVGYLQTAQEHAIRLQSLIADLVHWLRLGSEPMTHESCSIAELWNEAQQQESPLIVNLHAQITQDGNLPDITGDRKLLGEAFAHLLRNALLYHGPGVPHITLSVRRESSFWCVSIHDDGQGMTAAECRLAGGLFHRLHTWEEIPGNGMGLPITLRIITRHGGGVTIIPADESSGCTVQVRIPV